MTSVSGKLSSIFFPINQEVFQRVTLFENESVISCESRTAECFNQYFININGSLPFEPYVTMPSYVPLRDLIIDSLRKYENHPSIILIKTSIRCTQSVEFQSISCADIVNERSNLDR